VGASSVAPRHFTGRLGRDGRPSAAERHPDKSAEERMGLTARFAGMRTRGQPSLTPFERSCQSSIVALLAAPENSANPRSSDLRADVLGSLRLLELMRVGSGPANPWIAAPASTASLRVIAGDSMIRRPSHRAAARGQRSGSNSATRRQEARASARDSWPISRAASSARRKWRSRIALVKRPWAVPCDVIASRLGRRYMQRARSGMTDARSVCYRSGARPVLSSSCAISWCPLPLA
jgi:hypothetical protein